MICTKCHTDKDESEFYTKMNKGKPCLDKMCKFCYSVWKRSLRLRPKIQVDNKTCTICKIIKPSSGYSKNGSSKDGLMSHCKPCKKKVDLRSNLLRKYNLTLEEYLNMKRTQSDRCWICEMEKDLVVDHCHKSGKVRALLCHQCNTLIGFALESQGILDKAGLYLRSHS